VGTVSARTVHRITDEASLRAVIGGGPTEIVAAKILDHVTPLTRRFIDASPFVCVGTAADGGGLDVSPRGDPAGFVRVLDERTLLVPERPGNRIADTLVNLLSDDRIALLFLLPGVGDTFRVNGRAVITDDAGLLADSAIAGRAPKLGLLVHVLEAYVQCPKATIRSALWDVESQVERASLPSLGEILHEAQDLPGTAFDSAAYDRERAARYARGDGLY
jgi:PPOX class probable FMN-dependent enzyme